MFKIMKQSENIAAYVNEYVADTEADVADLPTSFKEAYPGSVCIVVETSNVYMLNNDMQWKLL